ncbi:hypothetical protein PHYPSEUDO_004194 [Phytophthora pseudosyringae]|uniref:Uncharacterized protein n=1 Tax=Phytophthora pseudosyringae TaxID=221518 RepID=A0A8T1VS39_9STRA|nr:hypothetical protein PHYPSEUDO_004194 [Phytophthora pseudosyringae]
MVVKVEAVRIQRQAATEFEFSRLVQAGDLNIRPWSVTDSVPITLPLSTADRTILEFKMQSGLGPFTIDDDTFSTLYLLVIRDRGCAGYVVLRFVFKCSDVWIMHRHIDWHLDSV